MKHNSFIKCFHCHNNPILHTFVLILKKKRFREDTETQNPKIVSKEKKDDILERKGRNLNKSINLKIAYKWQLMVLLARNPSLMKYRRPDKIDLDKLEGNLKDNVHSLNDRKDVGLSPHDNVNQLYSKNKAQKRNFYDKTAPSRRMNQDDDNYPIALKKKVRKTNKEKKTNKDKKKGKGKERDKQRDKERDKHKRREKEKKKEEEEVASKSHTKKKRDQSANKKKQDRSKSRKRKDKSRDRRTDSKDQSRKRKDRELKDKVEDSKRKAKQLNKHKSSKKSSNPFNLS